MLAKTQVLVQNFAQAPVSFIKNYVFPITIIKIFITFAYYFIFLRHENYKVNFSSDLSFRPVFIFYRQKY